MSIIKVGILGFGGMGNYHSMIASGFEEIEIVSVHDIDQERLNQGRAKGFKAFENRSEFLADPDINLVLIATPNHLHKPFAIEALEAGKHVIVEKPVALNLKEFDEIWTAAEKAKKLFTVHHNRRWDIDYLTMRQVIESGAIGKVYSIDTRVYGNNGMIYGWRTKPEYGGGMVYDWGVHLFDQILNMYPDKKLKSIYAQAFSMLNPEVEDLFKAEMLFEDGPSVHVEVSTFTLQKAPRLFVQGDKGTLVIEDFMASAGGIKLLRQRLDNMGQNIVNTPAGPTRTMAPQPEDCFETKVLPEPKENWTFFYENIIDVLQGKAQLIVTPETVSRTMKVVDAAFESIKTNSVIDLQI